MLTFEFLIHQYLLLSPHFNFTSKTLPLKSGGPMSLYLGKSKQEDWQTRREARCAANDVVAVLIITQIQIDGLASLDKYNHVKSYNISKIKKEVDTWNHLVWLKNRRMNDNKDDTFHFPLQETPKNWR